MDDPRGAGLLDRAFAGTDAGGMLANPTLLLCLRNMPLSRINAFPGGALSAGQIAALVTAASG